MVQNYWRYQNTFNPTSHLSCVISLVINRSKTPWKWKVEDLLIENIVELVNSNYFTTLLKVLKSACAELNGILSICWHSERESSQMETIFNNLCSNSNIDFWVYAVHYCHTNWCRFQSLWCAPERTMKSLRVCQTLTQSDIRGEKQRYIYGDEWHQNTSETLSRDFFFRLNYFQHNLSVWQKVLGDLLANGKYTHIWCLADSVSDSDIFSQKTRKRGTLCILPATEQPTANPLV